MTIIPAILNFEHCNPTFEHSYDEFESDMPKRVKHVNNKTEHFRKKWRAEYATSLREYRKLHEPKNPKLQNPNSSK